MPRIRLLQNLGLHDINEMNRKYDANIPTMKDGLPFAVIGAELDLPEAAIGYLRGKFAPAPGKDGKSPTIGMFEEVQGVAKAAEVRGIKNNDK